MIDRLHELLDGQRDFDDAKCTEEYIAEVAALPDGSAVCKDGIFSGTSFAGTRSRDLTNEAKPLIP